MTKALGFVQKGDTIEYANASGGKIEYLQVVVLANGIGLAAADIENGESGSLHLEGVFELPAVDDAAFAVGDTVYWLASSTNKVTKVQDSNKVAGVVMAIKGEAGTSAIVKINRKFAADVDNQSIGTLGDLTTTAKNTLVAAVNEIDVTRKANAIAIGTLGDLTTTEKTSAVEAINELDAEIGDLSTLDTTAKNTLVAAVNEVDAHSKAVLIAAGLLIADVELVVSAGGSTTQTVTGTLKDIAGQTITEQRKLTVIMVTDAEGDTASSAGANASCAPTTGTLLITHTAKLAMEIMTHTDGTFVITADNSGGGEPYTDRLAVYLPSGKAVVSAALNTAHE